MKKIMFFISALLVLVLMVLPLTASDRRDGKEGHSGYHQGHTYPTAREHYRNRYKAKDHHDGNRYYEYRHRKHPYKGYRSQPHGRYYGRPYKHDNYEYHYHGHWNSWGDWERYHKIYPNRFHHGRYYHDDDGHLFFRFCDPDGSACLFYSIGR